MLYANKNFLSFKPSTTSDDANVFEIDGKQYNSGSLKKRAQKISDMEGDILAVLSNPNCHNTFTTGITNLSNLGILPSILSNKYSIVFSKPEDALSILKNIPNPIVIHDDYTDKQTLSVWNMVILGFGLTRIEPLCKHC